MLRNELRLLGLRFIAGQQRQIALQPGNVGGSKLLLRQLTKARHQRQSTFTGAHALLRCLQLRPTGEPLLGEVAATQLCFSGGLIDPRGGRIATHTALAAQIEREVEASGCGAIRAFIVAGQLNFGVVERLPSRIEPGTRRGQLRFGGAITRMVLPGGLQRLAKCDWGLCIGGLGGHGQARQQTRCQNQDGQPRDATSSRRTNKVHWKIL